MRWQMQSQFKIPLVKFTEIYLFVCFASICLLLNRSSPVLQTPFTRSIPIPNKVTGRQEWRISTGPRKSVSQSRWSVRQCSTNAIVVLLHHRSHKLSQNYSELIVSVNKSNFAGCSTESPEIWEGKICLHRLKKKTTQRQKEVIFLTRIHIYMINEKKKIACFIASLC